MKSQNKLKLFEESLIFDISILQNIALDLIELIEVDNIIYNSQINAIRYAREGDWRNARHYLKFCDAELSNYYVFGKSEKEKIIAQAGFSLMNLINLNCDFANVIESTRLKKYFFHRKLLQKELERKEDFILELRKDFKLETETKKINYLLKIKNEEKDLSLFKEVIHRKATDIAWQECINEFLPKYNQIIEKYLGFVSEEFLKNNKK